MTQPPECRVIKYRPNGVLPDDTVAVLDVEHNVLTVNKELFDRLDAHQQKRTLFTQADVVIEA
jgi:hypothetical protein